MTGKEPEGREELEKGTNRNGKYDFKNPWNRKD
jgi:hypothetical protein